MYSSGSLECFIIHTTSLVANVTVICGTVACMYFFINPAVSEANMVDTCKHFEIGSRSVRSLSHLPVYVNEHLCRDEGATNTKQIK